MTTRRAFDHRILARQLRCAVEAHDGARDLDVVPAGSQLVHGPNAEARGHACDVRQRLAYTHVRRDERPVGLDGRADGDGNLVGRRIGRLAGREREDRDDVTAAWRDRAEIRRGRGGGGHVRQENRGKRGGRDDCRTAPHCGREL